MKRVLVLLIFIIELFFTPSCKKEDPAQLPIVSTTPATNITVTTATSGGTITDDGGATVTVNGVCWSTITNPSVTDSKTVDGGSIGQFVSNISGLAGGTTYHIRSYATNSVGTAYGADISFTSLGLAPTVLTQPVTNISTTGVTLNGTVNANHLSTVVTFEYGATVSYGQTATANQSPIIGNSIVNVSVAIIGLIPGNTYHFRIKTSNSLGTTYGDDMIFTTSGYTPSAVTQSACCLSTTSATLNGVVNANYLTTTITFEFGTTTSYGNSVTAIQSPITGNMNTNVSAALSGLAPGTTYHFRVKALNSLGMVNGNDMLFTTLGSAPSCATQSFTNISPTAAILYATVNPNFLSTTVVFEYGTSTSYGSTVTATQSPLSGDSNSGVSGSISGLTAGVTYHFRVKAFNVLGTTYGSDVSLKYTIADVEGNIYLTLTIGSQIWMAENLRTTKYRNGDIIGTTTPSTLDISGEISPKYQWAYDGNESNVSTYGRLYTWYAVTDNRNVCPTGWHIPTDEEWTTLSTYLGGESVSGGKLKEAGSSHWLSPNTGATNESGFAALPGGYHHFTGIFGYLGLYSNWWSSTQIGTYAYHRVLYYGNTITLRSYADKNVGFSVRCLKDF